MLTKEDILSSVSYDPESGHFTYVKSNCRKSVGEIAGSRKSGKKPYDKVYLVMCINRTMIRLHRAAWFLMTGEWPSHEIDHINGNGLDNRWENLRHVTRLENQRNQRKRSDNTSGITGVKWHKGMRQWEAVIQVKGETIHLGYSNTKDEAAKIRKDAEDQYGFHKNHGKDRPL